MSLQRRYLFAAHGRPGLTLSSIEPAASRWKKTSSCGPLRRRVQSAGHTMHWRGQTSSKQTRLVPLRVSTSETYFIEVGEGYFRFWRDGDPGGYLQIKSGYSVTAHSTGNDLLPGRCGGKRWHELCPRWQRRGDGFELCGCSLGWLLARLDRSIYEWPNDYTESELDAIQVQQINRRLLVPCVHPNHPPQLYRIRAGGTA